MEYYYVDGYAFETREEYNLALREQKNIRSIQSKMDMTNKESVLALYSKLTTRRLLVTPIGIAYMRKLRQMLIEDFSVEQTELPMIHVPSGRNGAATSKQEFTREQLVKQVAHKEAYIKRMWIVMVGLIVIVLGMFAITAINPNNAYINYKEKVENQYTEWQEQLEQRETAIKEKEAELGIDADSQQ